MDSLVEKTFKQAIQHLKNGDDKEAYNVFHQLAIKGDTESQIRLGYLLFMGSPHLIEKNIDKAMHWFALAQEHSSEAERMLAFCYLESGDIEKGVLHLENAFERKNTVAIVDLGDIYDFSKYGIEEDKEKALCCYTKGCKAKDIDGCKNMLLLLKELQINQYEYIKKNIGIFKFIIYWIPYCVFKRERKIASPPDMKRTTQ